MFVTPTTHRDHSVQIPHEELQRHFEKARAEGVEVTYEELVAAYLLREHP
jgi:hypothetical protein